MTVIRFKAPTRVRKDPAARTCCPSHNDRCRFGRRHVWSTPFYDPAGTWRDDGAYLCECGAICEADIPEGES